MSAPVRAMIVDDHADVRFLIRMIIEDAGGDVVVAGEAASAEAALAAIDAVDPDVVVLDALMPVVDGFAAAERIRARRPAQAILLCSGWVDGEVRRRAAAAGISACVSKDSFATIPAEIRRLARR